MRQGWFITNHDREYIKIKTGFLNYHRISYLGKWRKAFFFTSQKDDDNNDDDDDNNNFNNYNNNYNNNNKFKCKAFS